MSSPTSGRTRSVSPRTSCRLSRNPRPTCLRTTRRRATTLREGLFSPQWMNEKCVAKNKYAFCWFGTNGHASSRPREFSFTTGLILFFSVYAISRQTACRFQRSACAEKTLSLSSISYICLFFLFSCLFYSVWFHRGFYIFGAFSCIVFIGLGFVGVRYDLINSDQPEGLGSFFSSFTYFDLTLLEAWFWDLDLHIGSIWLDTYGHTYLLYFLFLILSPNKKE